MNEARLSDTISNDLMVMHHTHEAIAIALKSGEYNGEMIPSKEQKKLPQVDYRIERAIEIGEFLDKVVGNAPYRTYGVLAASYRLLCCNLNQRVNEIDEDKKPSEYASPKQLIPPKDIDIKSVERCKNTLEKWLANKELECYVKPFKEDINRLNKLISFRDGKFKKQKDYPGDKLVFNPFPESILYYANQLFSDCVNQILMATEITPEIKSIAKYVAQENQFSVAGTQIKFHKGHGFVSSLATQWEYLGIIGKFNNTKPRELLVKSYKEIIATIQNYNDDIRSIIERDRKPAGKIMTKTCGMDDALRDFERTYGLLTELLNGAIYDDKELTKSQADRLKEIDLYYHRIIDVSKSFVVLFNYLNFYQGHFGERRYARTWLKSGLNIAYDELTRIFYQALDNERFKNWTGCHKLKTPDIACGDTTVALKDIATWLNDKKAMKTLQDYEYDMEQSLNLKNIEQRLIDGQNEEYRKIVKPICDSFNEFTNITHYNCQEILREK